MVVDDDEGLAFILEQMLESEGHEVRRAADVAGARWIYLFFKPDLVITDIQMPERNGLELMSLIRTHNPRVKAIYMSGDLGRFRTLLEEEKKKYPVRMLQKPFSRKELMRLVSEQGFDEDACGRGRAGRELR